MAKHFLSMYPTAKLLIVSPTTFSKPKRQSSLQAIIDDNYDAAIIAYSCFLNIPLSNEYLICNLNNEINNIAQSVLQYKTTALKRKPKKLQSTLADLVAQSNVINEICFDELGINTLFVDEAHNFKNVPFETKAKNILGINSAGSDKCKQMYDKVMCVQMQNNGRGVVFATGTPITNSISDVYIMQKYLQGGTLASLEMSSFDAWISNFAQLATGFEIDVDTNGFRLARRFAKFHNLKDLTAVFAMVTDFYQGQLAKNKVISSEYTDVELPPSQELSTYLQEISSRADRVRSGRTSRTDDNMFKITTDGRKAALDIRLVQQNLSCTTSTKVFACAEKIYEIYKEGYDKNWTQLVFCDVSTPKKDFNVYDELKQQLISLGVLPTEISYIHDAKNDTDRETMFDKVRNSRIRVLIGSTWKLGMGVNVQTHLVALHHLDVPWRPADMVQREG